MEPTKIVDIAKETRHSTAKDGTGKNETKIEQKPQKTTNQQTNKSNPKTHFFVNTQLRVSAPAVCHV